MGHLELKAMWREAAAATAAIGASDEDPVAADCEGAERARLQGSHPGWRVWRSRDPEGNPAGWAATRLADDGIEPTLHASSSGELERLLESPGRRFGRPLAGGAL